MGTWGYAPWDNDSAADWFSELDKKPITTLIPEGLEGLASGSIANRIAAAWLLSTVARNHVYPSEFRENHVKMAIKTLEAIGEDWYEEWDDTPRARRMVQKLLTSLRDPARN